MTEQGNIQHKTKDDLTAIVWRDKCDVFILTNMHNPPTNGNFFGKHGNAVKLRII
jgi:hypothetical protein